MSSTDTSAPGDIIERVDTMQESAVQPAEELKRIAELPVEERAAALERLVEQLERELEAARVEVSDSHSI